MLTKLKLFISVTGVHTESLKSYGICANSFNSTVSKIQDHRNGDCIQCKLYDINSVNLNV